VRAALAHLRERRALVGYEPVASEPAVLRKAAARTQQIAARITDATFAASIVDVPRLSDRELERPLCT